MNARHLRAFAAAGVAASIAGCATLGGNVKGDFDCRAPEGSCAPTTLIDSAALGEAGTGMAPGTSTNQAPLTGGLRQADARSLRIVIAAYRDAAGRGSSMSRCPIIPPRAGMPRARPAKCSARSDARATMLRCCRHRQAITTRLSSHPFPCSFLRSW